jgi:hypothetical protein
MNKSPLILDIIDNEKVEEPKVDITEVEEKINTVIPNSYIPIKLESMGLLSAPKVLHFRDYTMEDALQLNTLDEEEQLLAIATTLTNMNYEHFDCRDLHPKELAQIVYSIHGVFINGKIEKEYYYNEDLPEGNKEGQLDHESNIGTVEIPVSKIETININKNPDGSNKEIKFKEPFTIHDKIAKTKVTLRLTRVHDLLFAKAYTDTKYEEQLKEFAPYKRKILKLREIKDINERNAELDKIIEEDYDYYDYYRKFLTEYDHTYASIVQASVIVSYNDIPCTDIDQKLEVYRTGMSQTIWQYYNKIINDYNFGLNEKYSFYCEKLNKNISRRFPFRFDEFLPNPSKDYSSRYNLSFN